MYEGLVSGGLALIPTTGALWLAMRNPKFVKVSTLLRLLISQKHLSLTPSLLTGYQLAESYGLGRHAGPLLLRLRLGEQAEPQNDGDGAGIRPLQRDGALHHD